MIKCSNKTQETGSEKIASRNLGRRIYELKDHLGNVRATLSNALAYNANTTSMDAQVISCTNYYPFGMMQYTNSRPANTNYRFGFNGKEIDNEVSGTGNMYDYGFRIYNPSIGKFLSVDPLTKSYPWYTPYQFAGNKPIWAIDLDGLEEYNFNLIRNDGETKLVLNSITDKSTFIHRWFDIPQPVTYTYNYNGQQYQFDDSNPLKNMEKHRQGFIKDPDGAISSGAVLSKDEYRVDWYRFNLQAMVAETMANQQMVVTGKMLKPRPSKVGVVSSRLNATVDNSGKYPLLRGVIKHSEDVTLEIEAQIVLDGKNAQLRNFCVATQEGGLADISMQNQVGRQIFKYRNELVDWGKSKGYKSLEVEYVRTRPDGSPLPDTEPGILKLY